MNNYGELKVFDAAALKVAGAGSTRLINIGRTQTTLNTFAVGISANGEVQERPDPASLKKAYGVAKTPAYSLVQAQQILMWKISQDRRPSAQQAKAKQWINEGSIKGGRAFNQKRNERAAEIIGKLTPVAKSKLDPDQELQRSLSRSKPSLAQKMKLEATAILKNAPKPKLNGSVLTANTTTKASLSSLRNSLNISSKLARRGNKYSALIALSSPEAMVAAAAKATLGAVLRYAEGGVSAPRPGKRMKPSAQFAYNA